ncbi:MAG TPA: asparagine synthase B [Edaphocola sp.]|nr:asparagine synthase B [Edaphocola sp.]
MCGIVCLFDAKQDTAILRPQVLEMSRKIRHRGPDWSGVFQDEKVIFSHERLAIVDPTSGKQPLFSADGDLVLAVNGEIYNHLELKEEFPDYSFQTQSDCEVILPLFQKYGVSFLNKLNGIFAFALYNKKTGAYFIARDHMGICPLYYGRDKSGNFYVASEMKALTDVCNTIEVFLPGCYLYSMDSMELQKWYQPEWVDYDVVKEKLTDLSVLRKGLEDAVHRQLMTDVPYGVLLSGGLDSSLIAAITSKFARNRIESEDKQEAWYPRLHSFAVGLKGSPDLEAAQKVAQHIGSIHHEIYFTIQEGLDAVPDVIYQLETYDITTIRASTPMYLLARAIKAMGIKMVLSGEGSDEIFGGYLYFHKAPNAQAFHEENVRKLEKLHLYDCLRANKALMSWGVEGRVPFLDKEFMEIAMMINPKDKMVNLDEGKMEKRILRKAFEDLLPESVLWRQKEQFSDGVGYSWIDTLNEVAEKEISDEMMLNAKYRFPLNTPQNKEEYRYRMIFEGHLPSDVSAATVPSVPSVACSSPIALAWDEAFKNANNPSGRAVKVHDKGY